MDKEKKELARERKRFIYLIIYIVVISISVISIILLYLNPFHMYYDLRNLLLTFPIGMLTGAVLSMIHIFIEKKHLERFPDKQEENIIKEIKTIKAENRSVIRSSISEALQPHFELSGAGVSDVFISNDTTKIKKDIVNAKDTIRLVARTGKKFLEDFKDELTVAIKKSSLRKLEIIVSTEAAAGAGNFKYICKMSNPKDDVIQFYKRYLELVNDLGVEYRNKIVIKEYKYALTGSLLIIDDNIFRFIPYLTGEMSNTSIAIMGKFKISSGKTVFSKLGTMYKYISDRSTHLKYDAIEERCK